MVYRHSYGRIFMKKNAMAASMLSRVKTSTPPRERIPGRESYSGEGWRSGPLKRNGCNHAGCSSIFIINNVTCGVFMVDHF